MSQKTGSTEYVFLRLGTCKSTADPKWGKSLCECPGAENGKSDLKPPSGSDSQQPNMKNLPVALTMNPVIVMTGPGGEFQIESVQLSVLFHAITAGRLFSMATGQGSVEDGPLVNFEIFSFRTFDTNSGGGRQGNMHCWQVITGAGGRIKGCSLAAGIGPDSDIVNLELIAKRLRVQEFASDGSLIPDGQADCEPGVEQVGAFPT